MYVCMRLCVYALNVFACACDDYAKLDKVLKMLNKLIFFFYKLVQNCILCVITVLPTKKHTLYIRTSKILKIKSMQH